MKKRSPLGVLLLSIITLGIYDIYWLVKVKKELNARTRVHVPSIWLLFLPVLLLVGVVVLSIVGQQVVRTGGSPQPGLGALTIILSWLAMLSLLPIAFYWFWKFSKAVGQYTNDKVSMAVSFLLLFVLRFIGMAIIQDAFNEMIDNGQTPGTPAMAAAPVPTAPYDPTHAGQGQPPAAQPQA